MTLTIPTFIQSAIDPYAEEARARVDGLQWTGEQWANIIARHLGNIDAELRSQHWETGHAKFSPVYTDTAVQPAVARVPMGTEWVLETWNAIMTVGTGVLILRVNGQFRACADVGLTGITTPQSALLAIGLHLTQGDEITLETVGVAAEQMAVYLQFKTRPIRSPRAANAGQPEIEPDRINNLDEELDRHSTPDIFQGASIRGPDAVRPPHLPPALPVVRG